MEWVFNENNGNAIAQGDAEFNTVLNSQRAMTINHYLFEKQYQILLIKNYQILQSL